MVPVIRIDEEVWKDLQKRAKPFVDTPNTVLRRILGMSDLSSENIEHRPTENKQGESRGMENSIFIVINAIGKVADEKNALNGRLITQGRVNNQVDIVAGVRNAEARKKLTTGTRIVMHQGGSARFRNKYGAGQIVAAGQVKAPPRELTEKDKHDFQRLYDLQSQLYPDRTFVGIILYDFPKGISKQPLTKDDIGYRPMPGDNFLEIKSDDQRFPVLDKWWKENY